MASNKKAIDAMNLKPISYGSLVMPLSWNIYLSIHYLLHRLLPSMDENIGRSGGHRHATVDLSAVAPVAAHNGRYAPIHYVSAATNNEMQKKKTLLAQGERRNKETKKKGTAAVET